MKIKNYLILSTALLSTVSLAEAGNFYAGAGAAYVNSASVSKLTGTIGRIVGSTTIVNSTAEIAPRFFAGYEKDTGSFFWGGELIGAFSDIRGKNSRDAVMADPGAPQVNLLSPNVKYSRQYTVGARLKMGGYITDSFSAFWAVGGIESQFKTTYTDAYMSQSSDKTVPGLEIGGGVAYNFSSHWRLGLEYFYQQYKTYTKSYFNSAHNYTATIQQKYKFNTLMASISYKI